jgi:hypothetical protein
MRVVYLVETPEHREEAELILDFVTRAVKPSVLEALDYLFIIERSFDESRDVNLAKRIAESIDEPQLWKALEKPVLEYITNGIYFEDYPIQGLSAVLWFVEKPHPGLLQDTPWLVYTYQRMASLVHELAHHHILTRQSSGEPLLNKLVESFASDTHIDVVVSLIRELLHRTREYWARQRRPANLRLLTQLMHCEKATDSFVDDVTHFVSQLTANYIAVNYFVLLNTKAHQSPISLGHIAHTSMATPSYRVHEPLWQFYESLLNLNDILYTLRDSIIEEQLTKVLPARDVDRLYEHVEEIDTAITTEVLPNYQKVVELVASEMLAEMPLHIYRRSPEKYSNIFKDINWAGLREFDVVFMT